MKNLNKVNHSCILKIALIFIHVIITVNLPGERFLPS